MLNISPSTIVVFVVLVAQLCPTLCDPMDHIAHQASLSMGFSRQEYWNRLSCPSQELNLGLLYCRQILYHLKHQESPKYYSKYIRNSLNL